MSPGVRYTVPVITESDLRTFQNSHFPGSTSPVDFFITQYDQETDEQDNLGYYADGQKRTLTDDEIAIFRHSETQALLRERRLAREDAILEDARQTEPGPASVAESKRKGIAAKPAGRISPTIETTEATKRKWDHFIDPSEENPDLLTHRRRARELDEVRPDSVALAYGEEEVPADQRASPAEAMRTFQWPCLGDTANGRGTT